MFVEDIPHGMIGVENGAPNFCGPGVRTSDCTADGSWSIMDDGGGGYLRSSGRVLATLAGLIVRNNQIGLLPPTLTFCSNVAPLAPAYYSNCRWEVFLGV